MRLRFRASTERERERELWTLLITLYCALLIREVLDAERVTERSSERESENESGA
jgi:hypothetical protein